MPGGGKVQKGAAAVKTLQDFEEKKRREEQNKDRLLMRLEDEMQRAMTSSKLIEDFWREQLRKLKSIELKKRIEVLSQQHDRQVDRKDAMIQMLFRDMEESEEQYRLALRTHLLNVDRLIHIQEERMEILQDEFERGLTEIQEEFEEEKLILDEDHKKAKDDVEETITAFREEHERIEEELKQEFAAQRDDIKNRASEDCTVLKIELEHKIDSYRVRMQEEHDDYTKETDPQLHEYYFLMDQDQVTTKTIKAQMRKIQRLQESLASWKAKLAVSVREGESRNSALREEKEKMGKHLKQLKGKMVKFREMEKRHLQELVLQSRATVKSLEEKVELAERLLRLAEVNRKMESEREKIMPFYESKLTEEEELVAKEQFMMEMAEQELADERDGEEVDEDEEKAGKALDETGRAVGAGERRADVVEKKDGVTVMGFDSELAMEHLKPLENFYRRLNKVMLDKISLEQEKARLHEENEGLKAMLKEYLDGISVNEEVMGRVNPLLVVQRAPTVAASTMSVPRGGGGMTMTTRRLVDVSTVEAAHVYQYMQGR